MFIQQGLALGKHLYKCLLLLLSPSSYKWEVWSTEKLITPQVVHVCIEEQVLKPGLTRKFYLANLDGTDDIFSPGRDLPWGLQIQVGYMDRGG